MFLLDAAAQFAWHVADEDVVRAVWSRELVEKLEKAAKREEDTLAGALVVDPGALTSHEAGVQQVYATIFLSVSRFQSRIARDLANLRDSWRVDGAPGRLRFALFDHFCASRVVRMAPVSDADAQYGICDFTGLPTADSREYVFGHLATDQVPPVRARIDRHAFQEVVRPLMLYAHFTAHMAAHADELYPNHTHEQKLCAFADELVELRDLVKALTKTRACDREIVTLKHHA